MGQRIRIGRAHQELARRDHHHLRAAGAFAETVARFQRLLLRDVKRRLRQRRHA
jgi:hypothetical protein